MLWDRGYYRNLETDATGRETRGMQAAYDDSHITVWLEGEKLTGGYALTHFRTEKGKKQWLLVKMHDTAADACRNPVSSEPESVKSGRDRDEIARKAKHD